MCGHSYSVSTRHRPRGSLLVSKPSISLAQDHEQERSTLWNQGCNGVREYVDAGELAQWLRHNEPGVNKEYSQKLASRTIDALTDLTKGRLYVPQKNRQKDRLPYKERRLVLPDESDIPDLSFGGRCASITPLEMFNNAIGAAAPAKDKLEINETDTLDSPTSWAADVLTCLTCEGILPSDTTISGLVECPRCQEVTTAPTEVEDE